MLKHKLKNKGECRVRMAVEILCRFPAGEIETYSRLHAPKILPINSD